MSSEELKQKVVFVAWSKSRGRSEEIAAALGGEAFCYHPHSGRSSTPKTLWRYARSFVATCAHLSERRPDVVVVSNPPIFAAIAVALFCRSTKARFLLDSHPAAFGAKGQSLYGRLEPVHRWLARRSSAVLTASEGFAEIAESWGAKGIVVHEAPTQWPRTTAENARFTAFFVCIFASDEPYGEVIEAARLIPEVDFVVTGDTSRIGGTPHDAPDNIEFCGFIDQIEYRRRLNDADLVISLTTEPGSVMRSAYEAVYARKSLLVSDWPNLKNVFEHAFHVENNASSIARGVDHFRELDRDVRDKSAEEAREQQLGRWRRQLDAIEEVLR